MKRYLQEKPENNLPSQLKFGPWTVPHIHSSSGQVVRHCCTLRQPRWRCTIRRVYHSTTKSARKHTLTRLQKHSTSVSSPVAEAQADSMSRPVCKPCSVQFPYWSKQRRLPLLRAARCRRQWWHTSRSIVSPPSHIFMQHDFTSRHITRSSRFGALHVWLIRDVPRFLKSCRAWDSQPNTRMPVMERGANMHFPKPSTSEHAHYHVAYPQTSVAGSSFNQGESQGS
jgi:hypothetical protein